MKSMHLSLGAVVIASLLLTGCGGLAIPPKLEVRDVGSGKTYTTYEPWGKVEKGVGYEFTDIQTGKRITLTNYELSTLEGPKSVPSDSPDAAAFKQAKAAGGVKQRRARMDCARHRAKALQATGFPTDSTHAMARTIMSDRCFPSFRSLGVTLAALCMTGCGSSDSRPVNAPPPSAVKPATPTPTPAPQPERSKAAEGVAGSGKVRNELLEAKKDVNASLASLAEVTDPATPDLKLPFNRFADAVAALEQRADNMKRESAAMRQSQSQYFAAWEEKVSDIENPTIRASAEARRTRLRAAQERLTTKAADVRDAYEPFMRDLKDVKKFLGDDLTKQSAALLGDASKKTQESGGVVNQKIDAALIAEMDAIDGNASPATRPAGT